MDNFKVEEPKKKKSKIKKILILLFFLLLFLGIYVGIKIFIWQSYVTEMFRNTGSTIYDSENNEIATLGAEKNQEIVSMSQIPDNLKNAYISIEDERFYSHFGVDVKRTSAAILNHFTKKSSSFGGSTITQQLVKNLTGDKDNKISRKVSEWFRAWSLELKYSKEDILEEYFNIIYVGPNMYGVQIASKYYFNKDVSDLSLVECAFLAGINNAPNSYNPFDKEDNSEKIQKRVKTVLNKMKELGYISEEQLSSAFSEVEKRHLF